MMWEVKKLKFFRLHFFKRQSRELHIQATLAFFEVIEGFTIDMDENSVRFNYVDPKTKQTARFLIMPKSQVADIYNLSPEFLDLNFQLEIPTTSPDYFFEKMLKIAKRLVERFDYYVYHDSFENVLPFKYDMSLRIFQMIKAKYLELNPSIAGEFIKVDRSVLNDIYKYLDEMLSLQKHYNSSETYVPFYYFFTNQNNELKIAFEWKYDTLTVIPAHVDYLVLNKNHEVIFIKFDEFFELANKFLEPVPGFIKDTYVVPKKNLRRINKILRSNKYTKLIEKLTKTTHDKLLDWGKYEKLYF